MSIVWLMAKAMRYYRLECVIQIVRIKSTLYHHMMKFIFFSSQPPLIIISCVFYYFDINTALQIDCAEYVAFGENIIINLQFKQYCLFFRKYKHECFSWKNILVINA